MQSVGGAVVADGKWDPEKGGLGLFGRGQPLLVAMLRRAGNHGLLGQWGANKMTICLKEPDPF